MTGSNDNHAATAPALAGPTGPAVSGGRSGRRAFSLHWFGLAPGDVVLVTQHAVMIPAMVGVMLWRYDHYAHH